MDKFGCGAATPHDELIAYLLDCRHPHTEHEHAAGREITSLQSRLALLEKVADIPDDSWKLITEFHNAVLKGAEVFGSPTKGTRYFFTLYEVVAKLRAALDAAKEGK